MARCLLFVVCLGFFARLNVLEEATERFVGMVELVFFRAWECATGSFFYARAVSMNEMLSKRWLISVVRSGWVYYWGSTAFAYSAFYVPRALRRRTWRTRPRRRSP